MRHDPLPEKGGADSSRPPLRSEETLYRIRRSEFSCFIEHGDHVFEIETGAIDRAHRKGQRGVAGLNGDGQTGEVLQKLREIRGASPRRETEVAGLVEVAFHVLGHFGRQVAHLAVLEAFLRERIDVGIAVSAR